MKSFSTKACHWILFSGILFISFTACRKTSDLFPGFDPFNHGHEKQTKNYSSEVALKWMDMQLRLLRTNATPIGPVLPSRPFAYSGIALYESVLPGMPGNKTLCGQLTSMPSMPDVSSGKSYHWAACANAALADMNRKLFPTTSPENLASIDSLETALNNVYRNEVNADELDRSVTFGKTVAELIFDWSKTDGSATDYPVYVPIVGDGFWVPTPPAYAPAAFPYWGKNRLFVPGSLEGSAPEPPVSYSTDPQSEYFKINQEIYDISQSLTPEQIAMAEYYRDNPGYGAGHYLSIVKQVLEQEQSKLDKSAIAYAKAGIALADATIGCWQTKYLYNAVRPVTYIRNIMGKSDWNPVIPTPNHPEYTSGHGAFSGSVAEIMTNLFGENYHFTEHTYDYLGMPPRPHTSFEAMSKEIGDSRVYGGIHYRISCDRGRLQGKKIGQNINNKLRFGK